MQSLERIGRLTEAGEMQLIHVSAVPRSVSTALGRALAAGASAGMYLHEPFNRCNRDIEAASTAILDVYNRYRSDGCPITVVTKSIARNMPTDAYARLAEVSTDIVMAVRNPLIQLASLATRIACDLSDQPIDGADETQLHNALPFVSECLERDAFRQPSWEAIHEHYMVSEVPGEIVVVDGNDLQTNPTATLSHLSAQLHAMNEGPVASGWQEPVVNANDNYPDLLDERGISLNPWISHAMHSDGMQQTQQRPALDPARMPDALRTYVESVAMPAYHDITGGR